MISKIERIPVIGAVAVRRKDNTEDPTDDQKQQQGRDQHDSDGHDEHARAKDRFALEKAMSDLRQVPSFAHSGMSVELIETAEGTRVKMVHAAGHTIRTMTAEEFLKLRDSSAGDGRARGKILDQKL